MSEISLIFPYFSKNYKISKYRFFSVQNIDKQFHWSACGLELKRSIKISFKSELEIYSNTEHDFQLCGTCGTKEFSIGVCLAVEGSVEEKGRYAV